MLLLIKGRGDKNYLIFFKYYITWTMISIDDKK